jgi:hypothetical protein
MHWDYGVQMTSGAKTCQSALPIPERTPVSLMLIFDCTQATCDFFSKKVKGKVVSQLQLSSPEDSLQDVGSSLYPAERWQLHVTKFGRTNVLLAMEVDTRYAMLFVSLKRNDFEGFFQQFLERYLGVMALMSANMQLSLPPQAQLQQHITRWEQSLRDVHFFKRNDRSVQTHINQVLDLAAYPAYARQSIPVEFQELIEFDELANRFLRAVRGSEYFYPAEVQIQLGYPRLGGTMTHEEVAAAYQSYRQDIYGF